MESKAKVPVAKTVDEYLARLPLEVQAILQAVRGAIVRGVPGVQEVISYQIPTYKFKRPFMHFAAFKDHCSLIVIDKTIISRLANELTGFKTTGTTIHFTVEKPLPTELLQKIVELRLQEKAELI